MQERTHIHIPGCLVHQNTKSEAQLLLVRFPDCHEPACKRKIQVGWGTWLLNLKLLHNLWVAFENGPIKLAINIICWGFVCQPAELSYITPFPLLTIGFFSWSFPDVTRLVKLKLEMSKWKSIKLVKIKVKECQKLKSIKLVKLKLK